MQRLRKNVFVWGRFGLLGLVGWMSWAACSALAQPANDNFVNAEFLPAQSGWVPGSNVGATPETGEPVILGIPGPASVWYRWIAPSDGTVSFSTFGSDFDTLLGAYIGSNVTSLAFVAGNDDAPTYSTLQSLITFPVTRGTTYFVKVAGFLAA